MQVGCGSCEITNILTNPGVWLIAGSLLTTILINLKPKKDRGTKK